MAMVTSVTMWTTMLTAQAGASWIDHLREAHKQGSQSATPQDHGTIYGVSTLIWIVVGMESSRLRIRVSRFVRIVVSPAGKLLARRSGFARRKRLAYLQCHLAQRHT